MARTVRPRFRDRGEPLLVLASRLVVDGRGVAWFPGVARVLVRCPRCAGPAVATRSTVTCTGCGWAKQGTGPLGGEVVAHVKSRCSRCGRRVLAQREVRRDRPVVPVRCPGCGVVTRHRATWVHENGGTAPQCRGLDLWLQTPCLGRVLWAFDETHLDFLERYVAAGLREEEPINCSLASRLPRWIKTAKHRDAVTRALSRLRATVPA